MADLAKLANLSKRLKTSEAKTHEDRSQLTTGAPPAPPADNGDDMPARSTSSPAITPISSAPAVSSGGGPGKVTVNMDLGPVADMLGRVRDEMRNLREELAKTRKEGIKIDLGGDAVEQMDQVLKHLSAMSKASREMAEKVVTSLPDSRWFGDLISLGREVGEGMVAGGGGGKGGSPEELNAIKEQLEMQKTQLTAILSILQRR